jgi:hypothetical protein
MKAIQLLIGLVLLLGGLTGLALAQEGPITPQHTDPSWQATYWNNTSLAGPPVLQRPETNLAYNWGTNAPAPGVNANQFSARWTRYIDVSPGDYQIRVTADDGVRLWVDEQLLIDHWNDHSATTYTAQKYLGPGHHLVRVEYYENSGEAVINVSWTQGGPAPTPTPAPPPGYGSWRAEYFNNKSLSGSPAVVRDEAQINFNWGGGSPASGVTSDGFSVRWSRNLDLPPGNYRFTMRVDDGARLFVNGHLLIDAWKDQGPTSYSGDIYLPGGWVTAQMEYYENTGGAVAQLTWAPATNPPPPPPPSSPVGYVIASWLNVRTGPGPYYPLTGALYRGDQVRLLARNWPGTWVKVETGYNVQGWVAARYLRSKISLYDLPVSP